MFPLGGRALNGLGVLTGLPNSTKLRIPKGEVRETDSGGEAPLSRGKEPRSSAKVPKAQLSGKGCGNVQTARRLA